MTQSSSYPTIPDEYVHSGSISCPLSFLALLMSKVDTSRAIDIRGSCLPLTLPGHNLVCERS